MQSAHGQFWYFVESNIVGDGADDDGSFLFATWNQRSEEANEIDCVPFFVMCRTRRDNESGGRLVFDMNKRLRMILLNFVPVRRAKKR